MKHLILGAGPAGYRCHAVAKALLDGWDEPILRGRLQNPNEYLVVTSSPKHLMKQWMAQRKPAKGRATPGVRQPVNRAAAA